jgi:hypothetical protein
MMPTLESDKEVDQRLLRLQQQQRPPLPQSTKKPPHLPDDP